MKTTALELLEHIDPCALGYQEWVSVGMALHHEGESAELWDLWSQRDSARYKPGDCHAKWRSFGQGGGSPVTGGTLHALAKQHGWSPPPERVYDWDSPITFREAAEAPTHKVLDPEWVDGVAVEAPANWNPVQDLIDYLGALYEATEYVSYVVEAREGKDGKWDPGKGCCQRTAGELIDALRACNGDIGAVLGDYNPKAGAWIRINPMDGKDQKRENVTSYRYALIESDTESIEKQRAIYDQLELPIVALVHSGKRSLHAIVKIDAATSQEHRDRFMFLHKVLKENGLEVDTNNKTVERLSRMPGVTRDGHPQFLVGLRQGKRSYEEWIEYIEESIPGCEAQTEKGPMLEKLPPNWFDLKLPPREFVFEGKLPVDAVSLLAAAGGTGKSTLALELAVSAAIGRPLLDCFKPTAGPSQVALVSVEDDLQEITRRLQRVARCFHVDYNRDEINRLRENLRLFAPQGFRILNAKSNGELLPSQDLNRLAGELAAFGPRLVILDPLSALLGGVIEENDNGQAQAVLGILRNACPPGAAVLLLAHVAKSDRLTGSSPRGAGAWGDGARQVLVLRPPDDRESIALEEDKLHAVALSCVKSNYSELSGPHWLMKSMDPATAGVLRGFDMGEYQRKAAAKKLMQQANVVLEALTKQPVTLQEARNSAKSIKGKEQAQLFREALDQSDIQIRQKDFPGIFRQLEKEGRVTSTLDGKRKVYTPVELCEKHD